MLDFELEKFIKDFNFRSFNIKRDYPRVSYVYGTPVNGSPSYYNYTNAVVEEIVELEIDKRSLENLTGIVSRADHFLTKERHEQYLRSKHPAIADAYSKYQMLLELYR